MDSERIRRQRRLLGTLAVLAGLAVLVFGAFWLLDFRRPAADTCARTPGRWSRFLAFDPETLQQRARQPGPGHRGGAGHRHHRRLDHRPARRDPVHAARGRDVLPRPHQPGGDGVLRHRLHRRRLGQPVGRRRFVPTSTVLSSVVFVTISLLHADALLRLRVRFPGSGEGHRAYRGADAGQRARRTRRARHAHDLRRPADQHPDQHGATGRHRGERAGAEGQGHRVERHHGVAAGRRRLPARQGAPAGGLVPRRPGPAREPRLRRAGGRLGRGHRRDQELGRMERLATAAGRVQRGAEGDAGGGARRGDRDPLRRRGGARRRARGPCWRWRSSS